MNLEVRLAIAIDAIDSRIRGFSDWLLEETGRPAFIGEIVRARRRDLARQAEL
jgi:hypothetical protein